jgi:hypothetical protein
MALNRLAQSLTVVSLDNPNFLTRFILSARP